MKHNIKNRVQNALARDARLAGNDKGFTIIEVALVLAIAGLIFLVVFIAWPALQNSQKDTAARQDVNHVVTAIESYKTDNQGSLPSPADPNSIKAIRAYATSNMATKLSTATSGVQWGTGTVGATSNKTTVFIQNGACTGTSADASSTIAVWITLSSGTVYCQNAS